MFKLMPPDNDTDKRDFRAILFLIVFAAGAYFYHVNFQGGPCARPIKYHLGTFDKSFGVSKESFLKAVSSAEDLWEKKEGKDLFEYTDKDGFSVNLIYDDRQAITERDTLLKANIADNSNLADSVRSELLALERQYDLASARYEKMLADFNNEQNAYLQRVKALNKKGGASGNEYQELTAERNRLSSGIAVIEEQRNEVNAIAQERNDLAKKYNLVAADINEKVDIVNQTAGERFDVGEYISDKEGERINIFQFENRDKMIRVLAHEFGHVLGIEHVSDPSSIMYELNVGTKVSLGTGDISALKELCEKK